MTLLQEIPIIKNIIKCLSKEFGTKIDYSEEENLIKNLGLENRDSIEKGLFYSVFVFFKKNDYSLSNSLDLQEVNSKVENCAKRLFKNCKFHKVNNDFMLIISTKFFNSFNEKGEAVNACEKNDVAILDYAKKKMYAQSPKVLKNFKKLLYSENISPKKLVPEKINSNSLSKIFDSKNLLIYEIEFHNLREPEIINFYLKAGSKQTNINRKIKKIIKEVFTDFGAYNLKSVVVSTKSHSKKRLKLMLIEDRFGIYKFIISTKNPDFDLKREVETILTSENIRINFPLKFTDEEIESIIIKLMNKKRIVGYEQEYKEEIKSWDKHKILKFQGRKLIVDDSNLLKLIRDLTKSEFELLENKEISMSDIKIKGHILVRKTDKKQLFFFLRKNPKDFKRLESLSLDKRVPFFYIETKDVKDNYDQRFMFTSFNKMKESESVFFFNRILDSPQLYQNIQKSFYWSLEKLRKGKRFFVRKSSQKKGYDWELVCLSLLNYIFKESFPLGRTYLPDGITFFTDKKSIIWDAKALNGKRSYLNISVKTKDRRSIKDTFYIEVFHEKGLSFNSYVYLTSGVSKEDFENVRLKLDRHLTKYKIKVGISCLTDNWLKSLAEYVSISDNLIRLQKNKEELLKLIEKQLETGYVDNFDKNSFDLIGKNELPFNTEEIRREVKEKMNASYSVQP